MCLDQIIAEAAALDVPSLWLCGWAANAVGLGDTFDVATRGVPGRRASQNSHRTSKSLLAKGVGGSAG